MTQERIDDAGAVEKAPAPTSGSRPAGRRFGDEEISRILQTAAELQERSHGLAPDARGLTLEEIRQIAREAGIDPRYVDLAVGDSDAPEERRQSRVAGGPVFWRFRTRVPGEISDDDRSRILQTLRDVMGHKGELDHVFGRMEWSHDDGLGPTIVGISSSDGETQIDVTSSRAQEAGLIHGLAVPLGGVLGAAVAAGAMGLSGAVVLPVLGATAAAAYGGARLLWKARSAWEERRLRRVIQRIASVAQEGATLPGGDGGAP